MNNFKTLLFEFFKIYSVFKNGVPSQTRTENNWLTAKRDTDFTKGTFALIGQFLFVSKSFCFNVCEIELLTTVIAVKIDTFFVY